MKHLLLAGLLTALAWAQSPGAEIVFVGAHPDDDSTATATLARYVQEGHTVAVITATRGEQGGNLCGPESGSALGVIREAEERAALGLLGIHQVYYLDCQDSGFTTSIRQSERNWGRATTLRRLVALLRELRPRVVISMSPGPRGHGDHQLVSQLATEAFFQLDSARKLYYSLEYGAQGLRPSLLMGGEAALERQALSLYKTQGWPERMPVQPQPEAFLLAVSRVLVDPHESDMLAGLQGPANSHFVRTKAPWELARTPALQRFLGWSRRLGLQLESLAPATRVCELGKGLSWPVLPKGSVQIPPATAVGPHPISIRGQRALLQVVPGLSLAGQDWSAWQSVNSSWEGRNGGPADASGRFRLRLAKQALEIEVEVRDDHLLSDLSPAENRAHWRTDAVEFCVDPGGCSEDNGPTFKLGVVVRNTAGKCMAARDADALPGPWTGRMTCDSLPAGYRLKVLVPLQQLPSKLHSSFGFNLLLYDVDPDQAPCRLAWSAWETVQGWPELWGRVHRGEK